MPRRDEAAKSRSLCWRRKGLHVGVANDEAGIGLLDGPGRREAALGNRHACGFKLANDGHDTRATQAYLGHCSIISTVRYTALKPNRFKNF